MRTLCWITVAFALLALPACAAKPQDLIVGKWQTTDLMGKVQYAEFSKDGSCSMPVPLFNIRIDGKYKFVDDKTIELDFSNKKMGRRKVEVTKETLTLTDEENSKTEIYKRVQ